MLRGKLGPEQLATPTAVRYAHSHILQWLAGHAQRANYKSTGLGVSGTMSTSTESHSESTAVYGHCCAILM